MRPSAANRSFSRKIRLTAAGLSSGRRIGLHVEQFGFVIERLVGPHSQRPVALGTVGQCGRNPQFHGTAAAQQLQPLAQPRGKRIKARAQRIATLVGGVNLPAVAPQRLDANGNAGRVGGDRPFEVAS